jgi:hypothetical protein
MSEALCKFKYSSVCYFLSFIFCEYQGFKGFVFWINTLRYFLLGYFRPVLWNVELDPRLFGVPKLERYRDAALISLALPPILMFDM